ncbi:MAG: Cell death protease [Bogoriella megaspora]|nr:MAG: Cell death protease [Bogoriella megaspora]
MAQKSAAEYFIHSLPGQPDGPLLKMHAGHVEITPEHHGNLFFWHFQNRHIGDRQRTVIWLNGGPGCSSMDGALMEVGPYRVNDNGTLRYNDGSWDEFANLLFIDNPVGTGFSYVDSDSYIHELPTMADQVVKFLEKWFTVFPEYSHDDIYLAGESYAGQHIPYIAQAMLDRNEKAIAGTAWNVSGMLIGNGWISPTDQYLSYVPFAYKHGVLESGSQGASQVEEQLATCTKKLNEGGNDHIDTNDCEQVLQEILKVTGTKEDGQNMCVNMYDVRLKDTSPSCGMNWPPDLTAVTPYLRRDDVVKALHIDDDKKTGWQECNRQVSSNFKARNSKPSIEMLPKLLEKVPTVLFSGEQDLICNHVGTESLIKGMSWNGGTGFEVSPGTWAPKHDWEFEGEPAGIYQSARNLTYVLFYNSSHMVPFDYPRRTRDMLDRFIGVDISSIGGQPADSRIDGEKAGVETSVGGHPNSTAAEEEQNEKLEEATKNAYWKSGEVVLLVVIIAALVWAFVVWKGRQKRGGMGYRGVGQQSMNGGMMNGGFRHKAENDDIEAADFDENELEGLAGDRRSGDMDRDRFAVGDDDDDDIPSSHRKE